MNLKPSCLFLYKWNVLGNDSGIPNKEIVIILYNINNIIAFKIQSIIMILSMFYKIINGSELPFINIYQSYKDLTPKCFFNIPLNKGENSATYLS